MKNLVIDFPSKEVDWDKPQWLIDKWNRNIVLYTGKHKGDLFSGTCLPSEDVPVGIYSKHFTKSNYRPLDFEINFVISNED